MYKSIFESAIDDEVTVLEESSQQDLLFIAASIAQYLISKPDDVLRNYAVKDLRGFKGYLPSSRVASKLDYPDSYVKIRKGLENDILKVIRKYLL